MPEEAQKEVARARDALSRLVRDVFQFDFVNLRLSAFVRSPVLRQLLDEAEKRFEVREYGNVAAICVAVHRALMDGWIAFTRDLFRIQRGYRHEDDVRRDEFLHALSAGVYLPDLRRFREATEHASGFVSAAGTLTGVRLPGWHDTAAHEADVRFALDFVDGLVLQIEPRFGSQLPPFLAAHAGGVVLAGTSADRVASSRDRRIHETRGYRASSGSIHCG